MDELRFNIVKEHGFLTQEGEPWSIELLKNHSSHSEVAKKAEGSILIEGQPGEGKTVAMKYIWNRLLYRRGTARGAKWISEMDLFVALSDEISGENMIRSVTSPKSAIYLFLDNICDGEAWNYISGRGYRQQQAALNVRRLWDKLYESRGWQTVIASTNCLDADLVSDGMLVRRMREVFRL